MNEIHVLDNHTVDKIAEAQTADMGKILRFLDLTCGMS